MRPLVRTRRQARHRLLVAVNAIDDVWRAIIRDKEHKTIPASAAGVVAFALSATRAAREALNHGNHSR